MSDPNRLPAYEDKRIDPPFMDSEREALDAWLTLYRDTLPLKIGGLTAEQLCVQPVSPSNLSLIGIVRHMSKVERYWFGNIVAGVDRPFLYCETDPDGDFHDIAPATALDDVERFRQEVAEAAQVTAVVTDLDAPLPGKRHGKELNLRWVYLHMIEEYARHLGHVDLIRESIDGTTGY